MKRIIGALLLGVPLIAAQTAAQIPGAAETATTCTPSNANLCLNDGRFTVTASWRKADGTSGQGNAVPLTADTGYFWFFDAANIEVATKVLNACVNPYNAYWVFASGLTNVGVTLTVTDNAAQTTRSYDNPVNTAFVAVQDTSAFETCSIPAMRNAQVTGTWGAYIGLNGVFSPAAFSLIQSGTSVKGTASIFRGGGGSLIGTVSGQTLNFTLSEVSPCPGTFTGAATVGGSNLTLTGDATGADCYGGYSATLDGVKTFLGGPAAAGSANIGGLWNATLTAGSSHYSAVIAFVQNGTSVTGTAVITGFGSGSLTGSVSGQTVIFTINELSPCLGVFTMGATISADNRSGSGTIVGEDYCGGQFQASISATKQ